MNFDRNTISCQNEKRINTYKMKDLENRAITRLLRAIINAVPFTDDEVTILEEVALGRKPATIAKKLDMKESAVKKLQHIAIIRFNMAATIAASFIEAFTNTIYAYWEGPRIAKRLIYLEEENERNKKRFQMIEGGMSVDEALRTDIDITKEMFLKVPIERLLLSVEAQRLLVVIAENLGDLLENYTEASIQNIDGMDPQLFAEVDSFIKRNGLHWKKV